MPALFKRKIADQNIGNFNPFIKQGDIIYLTSKSGRFKIIEVSEDNFKVTPEPMHPKDKVMTCKWSEFKRWSSINNAKY